MMSISEREQQTLDSIEYDLAASGPELASKLAMFAWLAAGEEMPPREPVSRAGGTPSLPPASAACPVPPAHPVPGAAGQEPSPGRVRRIRRTFGRWTAWRLLCLVLTIAFLALVLAVGHGSGRGTCAVSRTAACRQAQAPPPSPAGSGAGVTGIP